jgi:uncharacterized protein (DUF1501 family)
MFTRRDFLKTSSLVAFTPTVPGFLARTARAVEVERDARILVVIQLDGGNDGINTVVPYRDEGYTKHRKALRLRGESLIKLNDALGLHPNMGAASKLFEAGQLAIVPGVSYPNPNRSHFRSMAIWHSARLDPEEHAGTGWLGRALDQEVRPDASASALLVGPGSIPIALRGRRAQASSLERPEEFNLPAGFEARHRSLAGQAAQTKTTGGDSLNDFVERSLVDAYSTADRLAELGKVQKSTSSYPGSGLARHLQTVARLIKAGFGPRIYYTLQPGYDTHTSQLRTHQELLFDLSAAVKAFLDDLAEAKLGERVALLLFSEFGRTVKENGSEGTDHGTSGPVILAGPGVKSGIVGQMPSLLELDPEHGDLKTATDFRQVYATVLEDWLRIPAQPVLGARFEKLALFRS